METRRVGQRKHGNLHCCRYRLRLINGVGLCWKRESIRSEVTGHFSSTYDWGPSSSVVLMVRRGSTLAPLRWCVESKPAVSSLHRMTVV